MKLLFALTLCSAIHPRLFNADAATAGGGWTPPAPPADVPAADPSVALPGTEGSSVSVAAPAVEQNGAAQETPEAPLQDGATVHEAPGLTDEEKAKAAADAENALPEPKKPVMPPDVKEAITELIGDVLAKHEAAKAQAAQPHGGIGSEAAKVEAKFKSVPLDGDKREMVQFVNDAAKALALAVEEFVPAGKEKDFAHAAIMSAAMFSNSAISRS